MSVYLEHLVWQQMRQLHQTSRYPEVEVFHESARDVVRLGGVPGLDAWLIARFDLGLLHQTAELKRAAADLERCTEAVDTDALAKKQPKPCRSWEEQLALINERETKRRNTNPTPPRCTPSKPPTLTPEPTKAPRRLSLKERMAAAYESNLQQDVP